MHTTSLIRRHISLVPLRQLFTTRAFLSYGSRSAVDSALFRLVKVGWIRRVARGVFIRDDWREPREPSIDQVAKIKAESFGRQIGCHGRQAAIQLGIIDRSDQEEHAYAINGHSSSFRTGNLVIHLRGVCQRMLRAGDTKAGLAIRALWYIGPGMSSERVAAKATASFNRFEHDELRLHAGFMTAWMVSDFDWPVRCTAALMKGKLPPFP